MPRAIGAWPVLALQQFQVNIDEADKELLSHSPPSKKNVPTQNPLLYTHQRPIKKGESDTREMRISQQEDDTITNTSGGRNESRDARDH
eukprot:CAMPEP_0197435900 /NCGR_PEP_ID=MMETSP1175-20131217/3401_1 /TAXON_ID=1003142 /ORGANISM="Triceratium dubium, Strain CCMP147" /LENGTH=88 /DNA_ID=CAMNT_0042965045 /DNA_START=759 /DNA_END=1022 /DNA_ORIENTATION=+